MTNQPASRLTILYCEGDQEILGAQSGTFQKAGYQVVTASSRKAAEEAVRKNSFGLVVLGPTLSRNDRHHLPYMIKKMSTTTRILVMHTDGERHPYVDANLDTGCSMEEVMTKITSMSPATKAAAAGR